MPENQPRPPHPAPPPWPGKQWPAQHQAPPWPPYAPLPPRPESTLRAPLVWTAVFSSLGVIMVVGTFALILVLVLGFVYALIVAASGDENWSLGGFLGDFISSAFGPTLVLVLIASVIAFVLSAGVLVLLRLNTAVRRWAPALQGLCSAAVVYGAATLLLAMLSLAGQLLSS
ncbi:hypothetical protein [Nocardioides sp. Root140]|uniref:hypothetical protein n=1 Tax=Nocardioides sp. Root140 TaxID=1736460 RepID=UPI0006FBA5CC|nr:hypothetical protein [Nocardioides sp. Root140]